MSESPATRRTGSQRATTKVSYIDFTGDSDSDDEVDEVKPLQPSQKANANGVKRKRAAVELESEREHSDVENDTPDPDEDEDEDDLGEEEYDVDYIVASRFRTTRGKRILEYKIHWKGWDESADSWTLANQFDDDDPPVLDFYKKNPGAPRKGDPPKKPKARRSQPEKERAVKEKASVKNTSPVKKRTSSQKASASAKRIPALSESEDEVQISSPVKSQPKSTKPESGPAKSKPVAKAKGTLGTLFGYFSVQSKDKEAVSEPEPMEAVSSESDDKPSRSTTPKSLKSTTPAPEKPARSLQAAKADRRFKLHKLAKEKAAKAKRKEDSDGSDFVLDEDDAEASDDGSFDAQPSSEEEAQSDDLESDDEEVIPVSKKSAGPKSKPGKKRVAPNMSHYKSGVKPLGQKTDVRIAAKNLSEDLPPLVDIEAMFDHLVSRVPDISKLVTQLNGRKLRVATMCSGTESPLLALNMIAKAIKVQHNQTLAFEHVFSCEIEPFKQAYIERNFAPPLLFRDVTELKNAKAHTAYGSLVKVPGNVDLLIAGTSCVDYSNLNNQQQDIDAGGESGRTFKGMIKWVQKHRPPMVILENVCGAPWDTVVDRFDSIGYDAQYARLDTKEYYIPHTRTRVYLFATPRSSGPEKHLAYRWEKTVKDLRRPWSAPFEAFLLHTDDPHIHRARLDLASAKEQRDGTQRKATDWNRCESRHQRARQEEELGLLRPLTSWQEAGVCKGLDWTWNDWLLAQTERVVDLLDISTLRMAKDGIDSGFKACIWNVSQNVDRQTGSGRTALAPCLTPNMIPWVTNRGGPVTGREALALQGIPVRELLLTSENEDQLADLAGNAMTTTVVGASMLAALRVALDKLTPGENAAMDAEKHEEEVAQADEDVASRIVGESALKEHDLDLAKVATADLSKILDMSLRSARHCQCEGQSGTAAPIDVCTACGYRACQSCGGRPDHHYEPCDHTRVSPTEFEKHFKELLPMRVKIAGVTSDSLDAVRAKAEKIGKGKVKESDWALWSKAVLEGTQDAEFRFRYLKRGYTWVAIYEAPRAELGLYLENTTPEWRLTMKAPGSEPVNSRLRALLLHPVARLRFDVKGQDVLCGPWELCVPTRLSLSVEIEGAGELVPSWHASLGLLGEFGQTKRWSQLKVSLTDEAIKALDRDLTGTYDLLPKCGQAMNSLHKKQETDSDAGLSPLFFFLDPTRCGEADDDCYVFSTSTERLDFGTERAVIATLQSKWRETAKKRETVKLEVRGGWVECDEAHLTAVGGADIAVVSSTTASAGRDAATYAVPVSSQSISVDLSTSGCAHATAILSCSVPLDAGHAEEMWRDGQWGEIDLLHQGNATFANLAWITERLPSLESLASWNQLDSVDASGAACSRCAPRPPKIHWIKRAGKQVERKAGKGSTKVVKTKATIVAFEDKLEAGKYEHALKNRPTPFVVQLRLDDGRGRFRVGLNIVSLAHRALSRFPVSTAKGELKLSWRLTPGQVADVPRPPRVFVLPSNKLDPQHSQPNGFVLPLRKEQLRSLSWMLKQERAEGKTHTFVEEEISETALPSLGWRAEGKAERPVMVRGGVIADQVGYGKTIISLALVAETKGEPAPEPAPRGLIDLKATLIVVPGHLSKQWPGEITRFTKDLFKTIVIQDMRHLQSLSISELSKADIVVMASDIFESDSYWARFEYLSAQPEEWLNDKQGGRYFSDRLDTAMASLAQQVEELQTGGTEAVLENMKRVQEAAVKDAESKREAYKASEFGKRMKGQAYRDRFDAEDAKKQQKKSDTGASDDDDDDEEVEDVPVPEFRKASGTESFKSSSVAKNIKLLTCPLMHMFRFRRVIADEFTYLEKKALAALLRLSSSYKWVLSGTPPVGDFASIRSIATFMGIHLGVEDDGEGTLQAQKARAKEQTAAEKFHAFREVHSSAWHARRDDLAQEFLNVFVRQNIAEIDDIPTVEHVHPIRLPAAECAVYLELEHHLQALDMQARKETKFKNVTQGDRNARLEQALIDSRTAEEALLKRCCHFTLDLTDKKHDAKSAQEACEHIAKARSDQLVGCEKDLYSSINIAVGLNAHIKRKNGWTKSEDDRHHFREWVEHSFDVSKHQGDSEAAERLIKVLEKCGFKGPVIPAENVDGKTVKTDGNKVEDIKWQLREQTHLLRRLFKELVSRVRSLRFFEVVRRLQQNGQEAEETLEASECSHKPSTHPKAVMAVLSCCGHVACVDCMREAADNQVCVAAGKCHAAVRHTNIVKVSSLGVEGELSSGRYGAKLQRLVELIQSIPRKERVLVFFQWDDLMPKVTEALSSGKIQHMTLSGSVKHRAKTLTDFQDADEDDDDVPRVLLLKIHDASAAGSNLTNANHVIFLGPLFVPTLYRYRSTETQAIGRIRRFGQSKKVHVHRMLAVDTIDTTIFEQRRAEEGAKPDYVEIPQEEYIGKSAKRKLVPEVEIFSPTKKKRRVEAIEID